MALNFEHLGISGIDNSIKLLRILVLIYQITDVVINYLSFLNDIKVVINYDEYLINAFSNCTSKGMIWTKTIRGLNPNMIQNWKQCNQN